MRKQHKRIRGWQTVGAAGAACALLWTGTLCAAESGGQSSFASPDEAVAALIKAVTAKDAQELGKIYGPAMAEIADPDPVQNERHLTMFAQRLTESTQLVKKDDTTVILMIGKKNWPFPIPLVKKEGQWVFDTNAGKEEILNRRIGRNELSAIDVCRAYVKAQRDYALEDRNSDGVMEYAQRLMSTPGRRDGLYWEAQPGEAESPLGPLVAKAHEQGYAEGTGSQPARQPFHGYYFKILTRQGRQAPGGKYDYVINDHMVAGFALLAYPATWGNSGVMTFLVNQQGKVYQQNLGPKTAKLAQAIEAYNPDPKWQEVK